MEPIRCIAPVKWASCWVPSQHVHSCSSIQIYDSPHIFLLARRLHFTCFLRSAFSVPLRPVLHHLPFTVGLLLLHSDLQSSVNSSSGAWHVWNDGGHLGLLLFSSGSLLGTVLRNLPKVESVVADLVPGAWAPRWPASWIKKQSLVDASLERQPKTVTTDTRILSSSVFVLISCEYVMYVDMWKDGTLISCLLCVWMFSGLRCSCCSLTWTKKGHAIGNQLKKKICVWWAAWNRIQMGLSSDPERWQILTV